MTLQQTGYYLVSFHGVLAPAATATLPANLLVYLRQNGDNVQAASVSQNFQSAGQAASVAFSVVVAVTAAPTTLELVGEGGDFLYSNISLSVCKLSELA